MANEITIALSVRVIKDQLLLNFDLPANSRQFTMTGTKAGAPGVQTFTTAEADVDMSAVGTPGFVVLLNQDDTNWFRYGVNDYGGLVRFLELPPKAPALIYLGSGETLRGQAMTGTCDVRIIAIAR